MKILVLNCGSSSLKFQIVETDEVSARADTDRALAKGKIEEIGAHSALEYEIEGRPPLREKRSIPDHRSAVDACLALVASGSAAGTVGAVDTGGVVGGLDEIAAVGHRVVHGGERFTASARMDAAVVAAIEAYAELAPLHNPANLAGFRAAHAALPEAQHVAVFDTAFHQTMPREAWLYALPYELYQKHGVRRFGFHGTSHRFVSKRLARLVGREHDPAFRAITGHLGNGCSLAAVRGGRSIDTSMGFTPLEGLVMGTRSGDVDATALLHVLPREDFGPDVVDAVLNKRSGVLGISGLSSDMRVLLEAEKNGHERAKLAIDVFCYRLRKYVAAYVGALGGCDALALAGGIGENSAEIRARSLAGLEAVGIEIDAARNAARLPLEREISADSSLVRVFVVPTNEELLIARDTFRIVSGLAPE